MFHEHKINKLNYFSSISKVANFRVLQSRTTSILEGGDDEDIAKIESRTTLIQEGDDEDIATLDTPTTSSFPSCNSSPTQLPRHPRIQQTHR